MEPIFFGDSKAPLYGVYHAPRKHVPGAQGVVLCYPVGQEYMRTHRAFRQLADALCLLGYHVFRFDYFGLGNSAGTFRQARLSTWVANLQAAAEELKAIAQVSEVNLAAARVGTIVAAAAVEQIKPRKVVLWEPRLPNRVFVDEMHAVIEKKINTRRNFQSENGELHLNGFAFSRELIGDLSRGEVLDANWRQVDALHILTEALSEWQPALERTGLTNATLKYMESPGDWNSVDSFGGVFLPQVAVKEIVDIIGETG